MRLAALALAAGACFGQRFEQRGFFESTGLFYPQDAPGDAAHAVSGARLRYEALYNLAPVRLAGSFEARTDTHRETVRRLHLSWWDRGLKRPAFAVRTLNATWHRGPLTAQVGKQLIRWGKADLLNPTDRFAPRDFLNVVESEYLPVTAARVTAGGGANTLEVVFTPRLTPSRTPLPGHRWAPLPEGIAVEDLGARYPGGPQVGVRWNRTGGRVEFSASAFEGFNHLPAIEVLLRPSAVALRRAYPRIRSYGGDVAVPNRWFTVKAEGAYFDSRDRAADRYALYVIQLERQAGEWFFVGGYAGEKVTEKGPLPGFSPDRGLARAFLGRAGYTISATRSLAADTVVRQNGAGIWSRLEYSETFGNHWRVTAAVALIRGSQADFLGQYRRNSHASLVFRYSF